MNNQPNGVFITATGTDVGKTYVTALLLKRLRAQGVNAGYYKPALSGAGRNGTALFPGDAAEVCRTAGLTQPPERLVAYCFEPAVSPHLAARMAGTAILMEPIRRRFEEVAPQFDFTAVEGCGGLLCPLCMEEPALMLTDVIRMLGLPTLLVSDAGLGSIHAAYSTVLSAKALHIPLMGIVLNRFEAGNPLHEDNRVQIEHLTGLPVIACVSLGARDLNLDARALFSV